MSEPIVAGVELGGTKSIAVIGRGREVLAQCRVPTTTPAETLGALSRQLAAWHADYAPSAIGIASFGPVSVERGMMLPTPKPHWAGADIVGALAQGFDAVAFHTDTYHRTTAIDRHLRARDRHCRFPGCTTPATRCDIDHTHDHALGGPTTHTNLAHLCQRHHTQKHLTRWNVTQLPGGVLEWTSPTGRTYTDEPLPYSPAIHFLPDDPPPPDPHQPPPPF